MQDLGRTGHAHEGYPECGAMDVLSFEIANSLVGNSRTAAALECTALGPGVRIHGRVIAAASPNAGLAVNGNHVEPGKPLLLGDGDTLDMTAIDGFRAYLAFRGGISVPEVLGSRSTDMKSRIGGLEGRRLKAGDRLKIGKTGNSLQGAFLRWRAAHASLPAHPWTHAPSQVIHVTLGPQKVHFTERGIATFLSGTYTISMDSNRMGLRLEGPKIESDGGTDILSDGIMNGSIQVATGGLPIIMTADHQTTGGYAKIAAVIPTDLPVLAQMKPGEHIRFESVSEENALACYMACMESVDRLRKDMMIWEKWI